MNEGLFTAYQSLPAWKRLMERIGEGGCTALYEIAEGERPFLAAALSHATGRPVLVAEADCVEELLPPGIRPSPADLRDPAGALGRPCCWSRLRS